MARIARAAVTGRHVPDAEIDDSIARVPRSVKSLAPFVQFHATVDNSAEIPHLVEYCDQEACYCCKEKQWSPLSELLLPGREPHAAKLKGSIG